MREFVSSVSPKGQITLPAEVRRQFGVKPKDKVTVKVDDGQVRVTPASSGTDASYQAIPALPRSLSDQEMTDIAWEDHVEDVVREDR